MVPFGLSLCDKRKRAERRRKYAHTLKRREEVAVLGSGPHLLPTASVSDNMIFLLPLLSQCGEQYYYFPVPSWLKW